MVNVFFDSIASPFYNFGGLSEGNLHSMASKNMYSNPKKAALDGLEKMKLVYELGNHQFVLPPLRYDYEVFVDLFSIDGDLNKTFIEDPSLFRSIFSSASIWLANAWTHISSVDTINNKMYIRPANLASMRHRSIDVPYTLDILNDLFYFNDKFILLDPLDSSFYDEGVANLIRLSEYDYKGFYVGVYGSFNSNKYKPRQYKTTWKTYYDNNILNHSNFVLIEQNPLAIDSGVFHNDVISFGTSSLLVVHEYAFTNQRYILEKLKDKYLTFFNEPLTVVEIPDSLLSIKDALNLYFFNSQIVSLNSELFCLILPMKCKDNNVINKCIEKIRSSWKYSLDLRYVDLDESLKNGGGPACLRNVGYFLDHEIHLINNKYRFNYNNYKKIKHFILNNYPDKFYIDQLLDKDYLKKLNNINKEIHSFFS